MHRIRRRWELMTAWMARGCPSIGCTRDVLRRKQYFEAHEFDEVDETDKKKKKGFAHDRI